MQKSIKKTISILLSILMIVSVCAIVPFTASAEVGDLVPEDEYLTFTAEEAGSSVTLNVSTGSNLQYNRNNSGWEDYTKGAQITLENEGDSVRFCGKDTTFNTSKHFSITGKVACSGNVMSMRLNGGEVQGLDDYCFQYMFYNCIGLTTAPELPETMLANRCYYGMFEGCRNLTTAPELPATALAPNCYGYMFEGCTNLTTAPELWATTLEYGCYSYMFSGCERLTTVPELPATTLARYCYRNMFYGCTSLTELPALPATTLENGCYGSMFTGCSSIKLSETQTAEYSIPYSVPSGGDGTTASSALDYMFAGTGGTFTGTPEINKTYYLYREVPKYTVTWKNGDDVLETDTDVAEGTTPSYDGTTPTKASDTYYDYTFSGWFDGSNTYAADALPAVSGDVTYTAQFTSEARTFMVFVKKLTGATINVYDVSGETTVAQLKDILASQTGAPASAQQLIFAGKTLEDAKTLAEYNIQKESTIHLVIRGYTVTWKNWNGDVLETDTGVAADSTPTYDGETPYKADGANCIYTFSGWTPEVSAVTGDATYTATFTESEKPETIKDCTHQFFDAKIYSNVPFMENESDLLDGAISGYIPFPGDFAAIYDTKGYSYKFYDQTGTEIPATISYKEENAGNEGYGLSADDIVFKTAFSYTMPNDIKALYIVATEPAPAPAMLILNVGENGKVVMDNGTFGNATDAGNIADIARPVNVANGANASITDGQTCNVVEGGSINIATGGRVSFYVSADNTGVITAIPDEGYICTGWYNGDTLYSSDAALSYQSISEDITLTAKFEAIPTYTVTWKNWDGSELASEQVYYGATPSYDGETPTKPADANNTYTFAGWAPEITAVTGDTEYTAQFNAVPKPKLTLKVGEGGRVVLSDGIFGNDANPDYSIVQTSDMNVYTGYKREIISGISITFANGICGNVYTGGQLTFYPSSYNTGVITAVPDEGYICTGWYDGETLYSSDAVLSYKDISSIITLTAKFEAIPTHTVTWKNWDGTELATDEVAEGSTPAYTGEAPTKADDATNTYTFAAWDDGTTTYLLGEELPEVTGDVTYTAVFTAETKVPSGLTFDADGEIRYYVDGVPQYQGLVQDTDGSYYYINSTKKAVKNCDYSISEGKANGLLPAGKYKFGADGKMIIKSLLTLDDDGEIRYYVDNQPQYPGLVRDTDGSYYYVNSTKKAVRNCDYGISEGKANGLLPAGTYKFGADGKMIIRSLLTLDDDGEIRYYVDNQPQYQGLVRDTDGSYYYINSTKKAVKNCIYGISEGKANGLLPAGKYKFGADGKMILD